MDKAKKNDRADGDYRSGCAAVPVQMESQGNGSSEVQSEMTISYSSFGECQ